MDEFLCSLLATLTKVGTETIPVLLGFGAAVLLFEFTERRRERRAQGELRRALKAELENAEVLASILVIKYARTSKSKEDKAFVASAIRWYTEHGSQRMHGLGVTADLPSDPTEFISLSDDALVALSSNIKETRGTKIIVPVLDRALAGQTLGLRADQIQALSMVRWQLQLLEQEAEFMTEMFHFTFTITDAEMHEIVLENHDKHINDYGLRARVLLRTIRAALQLIG